MSRCHPGTTTPNHNGVGLGCQGLLLFFHWTLARGQIWLVSTPWTGWGDPKWVQRCPEHSPTPSRNLGKQIAATTLGRLYFSEPICAIVPT